MRKLSISLQLSLHSKAPFNSPPIEIVVYDTPSLSLPNHHAEYVAKEFNAHCQNVDPFSAYSKKILVLGKEHDILTYRKFTREDIAYIVLKAIEEEQLQMLEPPTPKSKSKYWTIKFVETHPANIQFDLERIKIPKTDTIHSTNTVLMEDGRIYFIIIHKN